MGGFSEDHLLCIDQRGFKTTIQDEAAEFLTPEQTMLNATVNTISYSDSGVKVSLTDGTMLEANYVLVTFSVGVLQNDDVNFDPVLPDWKQESIQSINMVKYWFVSSSEHIVTILDSDRRRTSRYFFSFRRTSGSTLRLGLYSLCFSLECDE